MQPLALIAAQQEPDDVTKSAWDILIEVGTQITVLVGLLGLLGWLLWPRLRDGLRDITETRKQVAEANEGTHLRDAMQRVETKVDSLDNHQRATAERLDKHIRVADKSLTVYRYILREQGIELPEVRDE